VLLDRNPDIKGAITLLPTREQIDQVNNREFDRLPTKALSYSSHDHFQLQEKHEADDRVRKLGREGADGSLEALVSMFACYTEPVLTFYARMTTATMQRSCSKRACE